MRKALQVILDSTEGEPLQEIVCAAFERLRQGGKTSACRNIVLLTKPVIMVP
jgi:hypothetical protein